MPARSHVLHYLLLVGIPLLGIVGILHLGRNLPPPLPALSAPSPTSTTAPNLVTLLLQVAAIVITARLTSWSTPLAVRQPLPLLPPERNPRDCSAGCGAFFVTPAASIVRDHHSYEHTDRSLR